MKKSIILYLVFTICLTIFAVFLFISFFNQDNDENIDYELKARQFVEETYSIILPEECELVYWWEESGFRPGGFWVIMYLIFRNIQLNLLKNMDLRMKKWSFWRKSKAKIQII